MAKVKLDLLHKDFIQTKTFAEAHRDAMAGNGYFTEPVPTAIVFDAKLTEYVDKLAEIATAELDLAVLRAERDVLLGEVQTNLTDRGGYVDTKSAGALVQILSAAFDVQAEGTVTTSIDKPYNVVATMGDNEGEIDVGCHAVPKGKSYIYEMREHSDTAAPGPWGSAKFGNRSSATFSGLVSGKKYAFRIRALGPNELESPWSDEVICMAP